MSAALLPRLERSLEVLGDASDTIDPDRRERLDAIRNAVAQAMRSGAPVHLVFVCTHNSRRSHLAQLWAQAAALHHGVESVVTHSAGTEVTAFHPNAVAALRRAGFGIPEPEGAENPVYAVRLGDETPIVRCFSKRFDDPSLPHGPFIAVMVCDHAAEHCPVIPAAAQRLVLPYRDPKESDGSPEEAATYDARCLEIERDMAYLFATG